MSLCSRLNLNQLVLLAVFALLCSQVLARPFSNSKSRRRRGDVNPFPSNVPTSSPDDDGSEPCVFAQEDVYENGTVIRIVNYCCVGYTGPDCSEKIQRPFKEVDFDPEDPCKGLVCESVEEAECTIIAKCGERLPVFLTYDGSIAECTNGQPVNVSRLTCNNRCAVDPCKDAMCRASPDAICFHTACNCEPIWLRTDGVQLDCDTGEALSPEEAKKRRRKKRQAEETVESSSLPPCA